MKLRYLFALPILATALMGCDEIEKSDAKPVENPQLPSITQEDFSVAPASTLTSFMNLDALVASTPDADAEMLQLYTINVLTENLPAGSEVTGGLQFAKTSDFKDVFDVTDITFTDGVAQVPLSSILYTRSAMFGPNDPREYEIYYRIPVYVTANGGQYKIGDKDYYYCAGDNFQQEGVDPGYVIEEAYYLLGPQGTTLESAIPFTHNEYNIYDDTNFTVIADFGEGMTSWLIVPQSAYEAAQGGTLDTSLCYGPTTAAALKGTLDLGGQPGALTAGNRYSFSFDAKALTYEIQELATFENLYTPGDSNGWVQSESQMLSTNDFITYTGFAYLQGGFKFTSELNWDGFNYGSAGEGKLMLGGSDNNITVKEAALYWCNVNVLNLTYSLTEITSASLIGVNGDWDNDIELTAVGDQKLEWTGTMTLNEEGGWKFRFNNDWAVNLGGSTTNLVLNGDNITTPAGTYTVTLDLSKLPYSCTVVAK
ncbi:MAG: SusF/SusE family outer membrane protein [Muribaculaceae bacterium]|nr:SusF/SusE family outer membrane protein [Muribaculaceae bacterium]